MRRRRDLVDDARDRARLMSDFDGQIFAARLTYQQAVASQCATANRAYEFERRPRDVAIPMRRYTPAGCAGALLCAAHAD